MLHRSLAAPLAVALIALTSATALASAPFRWSAPKQIDRTTYPAHPTHVSSLACPSEALCVGVGGKGMIAASTQPASPTAWKAFTVGAGSLADVSCASDALCLAIDAAGTIVRSTDPAAGAGAWSALGQPFGRLDRNNSYGPSIACPTTSLCVALDGTNVVATTTDPAAPAPTWTTREIGRYLELSAIACPSAAGCLALDDDGYLAVSTNPTGDAAAWRLQELSDEIEEVTDISCASPSACVLAGRIGGVGASADAFAARPTWDFAFLSDDDARGVSCVPGGFCAVAGDDGGVLVASSPTGGEKAWTQTTGADPSGLTAIACASASLCIAESARGGLVVSTAPTSGQPKWTPLPPLVDGEKLPNRVADVDCASVRLCVAVDDGGNVLGTASPTGGPNAWKPTAIHPGLSFEAVSCTQGFCAAVDSSSFVATSTRPLGADAAWTLTDLVRTSYNSTDEVTDRDALHEVSCASRTLCVATRETASDGALEVSLDPAAATPTWTTRDLGDKHGHAFFGMSCPTRTLCVTSGMFGRIATSTDAGRHWRGAYVEARSANRGSLTPVIADVSCPTRTFCAAVDDIGQVLVSHAPANGPGAWHRSRIAGRHRLDSIDCTSASLCVGIDGKGRVLTSTARDVPGSSWRTAPAVKQPVVRVACAASKLCLLVTKRGELIAGTRSGR